jgi:Na+-driven multidrug efflux pump
MAQSLQIFNIGVILLRVSAINILYIAFLQISTAILQGLSKTYAPMFNLLFACTLKIALTLLLVNQSFYIVGSAIANTVCYMFASI